MSKNQPKPKASSNQIPRIMMAVNSSDEDIFFSGDEYNGGEASSNYTKNEHNAHYKQGYVDGVSTFNNDLIQQNCDSTFRVGNLLGFRIGKLIGKIQYLLRHDETNMNKFLDKLNVNSILQEKNFDDDYKNFLNDEYILSIEKEFYDFINEK